MPSTDITTQTAADAALADACCVVADALANVKAEEDAVLAAACCVVEEAVDAVIDDQTIVAAGSTWGWMERKHGGSEKIIAMTPAEYERAFTKARAEFIDAYERVHGVTPSGCICG